MYTSSISDDVRHGDGAVGRGRALQQRHLLPGDAAPEGARRRAGQEIQEGRDAGHRGRGQRRVHDPGCLLRHRHRRKGGDAGKDCLNISH